MPLHNVVEPFRRTRLAQQIVAALFALGPVLLPDGGHFVHDTIFDQSQAWPVVSFFRALPGLVLPGGESPEIGISLQSMIFRSFSH